MIQHSKMCDVLFLAKLHCFGFIQLYLFLGSKSQDLYSCPGQRFIKPGAGEGLYANGLMKV